VPTQVERPRPSLQYSHVASTGVVTAVWWCAWIVRMQYSSPNVDDYAYTMVARGIWLPFANGDLLGGVRAFLGTGKNAPLVPAMGAPFSNLGPDFVVLVQFPLLIALTTFVFLIVHRIVGHKRASMAALMTALSAPVLNWSLMVHMALAATVCALGVVDAYLRSDGFARRWPSMWVGIWIGLLALSRSIAPVYVATMCATLLLGVLIFHRRDVVRHSPNMIGGMLAAGAVAAPWYWSSGPAALSWLGSVGYSAGSGFVESGSHLRIRFETTRHEAGDALIALLLLMLALALLERGSRRRAASENIAKETRFVLFVFAGLVMSFLTTTKVAGTAFALPAVVAVIPAVFLCLPREGPAAKILAPACLVVAGLAVMQACLVSGWEGRSRAAPAPLYADGVLAAIGGPRPGTAARVTDYIAGIVREKDIFITRDDAVVNVQGIRYLKLRNKWGGRVGFPSYNLASSRVRVPSNYAFVLSGQSCAPYHRNVDRAVIESSLEVEGWSVVASLKLSGCNDVVLWQRAP
jgi:hypothetical protein